MQESAKYEKVLTNNRLAYSALCWADNRRLNLALNEVVSVLEEQVPFLLPAQTLTSVPCCDEAQLFYYNCCKTDYKLAWAGEDSQIYHSNVFRGIS
ncbi:MAG: hypothetical protein EAZ18_00035 [Oscillatoriales cyanobacterium]|nr:MAG: hypothetical protein EAZ18_00035 [Oscillatoriales cyanobacterium]